MPSSSLVECQVEFEDWVEVWVEVGVKVGVDVGFGGVGLTFLVGWVGGWLGWLEKSDIKKSS